MQEINCKDKGISISAFQAITHGLQGCSLNSEGVARKL
jgi:hypothetical protein